MPRSSAHDDARRTQFVTRVSRDSLQDNAGVRRDDERWAEHPRLEPGTELALDVSVRDYAGTGLRGLRRYG